MHCELETTLLLTILLEQLQYRKRMFPSQAAFDFRNMHHDSTGSHSNE